MAIASSVSAMAQVDHFSNSTDCLAAHNPYTPSILHPRPMVAGEVLLPHPNGGCAEMTLPDRLGGRGWVWVPANGDVIVGGGGMRYAVCGNKIFNFVLAPAPALPIEKVSATKPLNQAQTLPVQQPTQQTQIVYVVQPQQRPEYQPQQQYQPVSQPVIEPEYVTYVPYTYDVVNFGGIQFYWDNYRHCYHHGGGYGHGGQRPVSGGGTRPPTGGSGGGTLPPGGGSGGGTTNPSAHGGTFGHSGNYGGSGHYGSGGSYGGGGGHR